MSRPEVDHPFLVILGALVLIIAFSIGYWWLARQVNVYVFTGIYILVALFFGLTKVIRDS